MSTKFSDGLNFMSKQTPSRLRNMVRTYSSFRPSKLFGNVNHRGMPVSISIEPTNSCNLRCPECPSGLRSFTRPTGMMNGELLESVVNQLAPSTAYLIFYVPADPYS